MPSVLPAGALDRRILSLALPSIVSNITVPLLGLCDVTVMGHTGGAAHIGAIAVGSMVFNVMYWLFGFLRMGTSGLTSQALGGRRLEECTSVLRRSLLWGVGLGLAIVVLQVPLRHLTFFLMQPSDSVLALCRPYYQVCVWGAPAVLGLYALTGWFVGMQNTRAPMTIAIGQNIVNIAASLFLVVVARRGIAGVALGTLIAQWSGFLAALLLLWRGYGRLLRRYRPSGRSRAGTPGRGQGFLRLNLDIFLRTACLVAVNLYFTSAGAMQGAGILAANTLLMQFFTFFSYIMDGLAYAGEALAGRHLGARNWPLLRHTIGRLFGWGSVVTIVFTAVYWLCGPTLLRLLTTDVHVVSIATAYLPWAVLIPLAGMGAFVWDGIFIGITATRGMLWSCFWGAIVFFALFFLLHPSLGNHALWIALLAYLAVRGLVLTAIANREKKGWH